MPTPHSPTILVFDSGLGGLTVFREIAAARPDAQARLCGRRRVLSLWRGTARPSSSRASSPLIGDLIARHRARSRRDRLQHGLDPGAAATARAAIAVPFVGTVPAIKPACAASKTKRVSVLGTEATVKREYTRALIRDFAQGCEVTLVGSAAGSRRSPRPRCARKPVDDAAIAAEIAPCFVDDGARRTDTVVLACTHYPLAARPARAPRALAGRLDRSGARDRAPRGRSCSARRTAARQRTPMRCSPPAAPPPRPWRRP